MKKALFTVLFSSILIVLLHVTAYAVTATIDTKDSAKGIVKVTLAEIGSAQVGAIVQKGDDRYQYLNLREASILPLQMGTGDYVITVGEIVGGKLKTIAAEKVTVTSIDEKVMFTYSNPMVNYAISKTAIPTMKKLSNGAKNDKDKVVPIYEDIVKTFKYDQELANKVIAKTVTNYVPDIDMVYAEKKGICYGYSAVFGGALRSLDIPTRMVWGFVPVPGLEDVLHAWNEVLLDGKWVAVDTTFDTESYRAGQKYDMIKDRSKAKIAKIY